MYLILELGVYILDNNKTRNHLLGSILAIIGALLWGIQGPVSQFLFQDNHLSPEWLMGIKMGISGIFILMFSKFYRKEHLMQLWKKPKNIFVFIMYAVFGLAAVQYLYLVTVNLSNAGTATILQSLGTVLIVIFTAIFYNKLPNKFEFIAVIVALVGTWLLVTRGNLTQLSISTPALTTGLLLALAGAIQTMLPVNLLKKFSSLMVVGWAMLVGGILFTIIHPFWVEVPKFTLGTILGVLFIVFFGTMASFLCFINSLKFISPTVAGMLDTFEPLSATLGAIIFLNTSFNGYEVIGGILILSTVFILALGSKK
ncbi:EamA family transporter [Apilactobacillus micheneri]|uniref:EamA family transporter n=1 Tax=Apilactobacillus micheneri TaxID=1899430 RepID=A0ABY2YWW8_9LACO|nr:EamA family transporter [Apilactobacillus micheneri]TPR25897.1 EamA family transporter [Apilactobacillus micheneri]TPR28087.1 EamA family transporter [Apilactobacillus micheneri]TPR29578.1 EamA family transporter [Apilactobacillus micheneri]TPR30364.1 EamA family transporter [Apilactobacillus micheneri]